MQTLMFSELADSLGSLLWWIALCCTNLTLKGSRALEGCEETAQQGLARDVCPQKLPLTETLTHKFSLHTLSWPTKWKCKSNADTNASNPPKAHDRSHPISPTGWPPPASPQCTLANAFWCIPTTPWVSYWECACDRAWWGDPFPSLFPVANRNLRYCQPPHYTPSASTSGTYNGPWSFGPCLLQALTFLSLHALRILQVWPGRAQENTYSCLRTLFFIMPNSQIPHCLWKPRCENSAFLHSSALRSAKQWAAPHSPTAMHFHKKKGTEALPSTAVL